jgi:hypothetical protein
MTETAGEPRDRELQAIAQLLQGQLGELVEAAETVLAELDEVDDLLTAPDSDVLLGRARAARRDALRSQTEAIELAAHARDVCARSRELEATLAARIERARTLMR